MAKLDRRTFLLLLIALAVMPKGQAGASALICQICGEVITRGSRAGKLAELGQWPEDQLRLKCLTSQMTERIPECTRCDAPFILDDRAAHLAALVAPTRELCFECLLSFIDVRGIYAYGDPLMIRVRIPMSPEENGYHLPG
jgi:hypothetical protein